MSVTADNPIAVELIAVGRTVPRRGYGVLRWLGRRVLAWMRWRAEGHFPDSPRLVVVIAPHSSIRDFVIGAAVLYVLGLRVAFIAKHTLFRWPLGGFMRWLGGIAVNRAQPENIVGTMTAAFSREEKLWLVITPEGTRREGARFKSGFYRIARAAGVPILPVYFNYRRKVIGFLPLLQPVAGVESGVAQVRELLLRHGARRRDRDQ